MKDGEKYYCDKNYVVNHINENKGDNDIKNLEWTTIRGNTIHSVGKKVAKIDPNSNEIIKTYSCIADASIDLGKNFLSGKTMIVQVCKDKRQTAYGFKWKYID